MTILVHRTAAMRPFKKGERVAAYGNKNGKIVRFGKGVVTRSAPVRVGNNSLPTYIKIRLDDGMEAYFPEIECKHLIPKTTTSGPTK